MMNIAYRNAALQSLKRIAPEIALRIRAKINQYAADPTGLANMVRAISGAPALRLRVGDYRIIFTVESNTLTVLQIGHRRDIYR